MSIINRLTSPHLDDDALAEVWTNAVAGGTRGTHPHLDACAECRVRYASFTACMDDLRTDALAQADRAFAAERLVAQQAQIARRLEVLDEPTRVIAFPRTPVVASRRSPLRGWVAGAAAAGLITGIGLGQLMDLRHLTSGPSTFPADRVVETARTPIQNGASVVPAALGTASDALVELEEPATPQYEALRAYDTFTPRAADLLLSAR